MRGFSLTRFRPEVVILENLLKKQEYADYMAGQGYARWLPLGLNEVYVRNDRLTTTVRILGVLEQLRYKSLSLVSRVKRKLLGTGS